MLPYVFAERLVGEELGHKHSDLVECGLVLGSPHIGFGDIGDASGLGYVVHGASVTELARL